MHKDNRQLSAGSKPWEFAEVFLPMHQTDKIEDLFSFANLAQWTNMKAGPSGAGETACQHEWRPFTATEMRQIFGLHIHQGINPLPWIECKPRPQWIDGLCGNNFVHHSFKGNAERRHKHFKAFLTCVDPLAPRQPRDVRPNWKVHGSMSWMNHQSVKLWDAGKATSVNEMTMRFKGRHEDKKRMTCKAEGDGFQADALCNNGHTHQVCL